MRDEKCILRAKERAKNLFLLLGFEILRQRREWKRRSGVFGHIECGRNSYFVSGNEIDRFEREN